MSIREYDQSRDAFYSPDDTPLLYLSKEAVVEALKHIPLFEDDAEKSVRSVITQIETLNRQEKVGDISHDECLVQNRAIADSFLAKYDIWPYVTQTYQQFYDFFRRGY